ncbi:MAG: type II toxin-antitoxin system PemK/MazF family toxin [Candidatus Liptonbacteria bacterium]|nr:type II toxin-antitoxin system PemK/MazF family toxin [Candidatus Liptonbacteria bacterium]
MLAGYFLALLDWCKIKIFLRTKKHGAVFKEGELWWCRIGMNVGVEIFGKGRQFARPVLVFKKLNADSFLGVPLTSQRKEGSWYVPVRCEGIEASAILSQVRVLDKQRLMGRIETLSGVSFSMVKHSFLELYS